MLNLDERITIDRWENDDSWMGACLSLTSETPYRALHRELTLLRVREAGFVLRYFGYRPEGEKSVGHALEMIRLLSDRERKEISDGNFGRLKSLLYEPDVKRETKMAKYAEDCGATPDFVLANQKHFSEKGLKALR